MMMKKLLAAAVLSSLAAPAFACSQMSPFAVFVGGNDTNQDSKLSRKEFLRAKVDNNLILTFKLNKRAFRKLDKNKSGFLEFNEDGYDSVTYKRAPCADWEEQMQKMMEQEKSELNQENRPQPAQ